jgi:hypothetical protein
MAYYFSHLVPLVNIKNLNDSKELNIKYPKYNFRNIVSNYLQKPAKSINFNFKRKNTQIIIEDEIILDYNRIINQHCIEYELINYTKLIKKTAICIHNDYYDNLEWTYYIAKNNKLIIYNSSENSITIKFYSSNRLKIEDYEEDPLYIKYKRQGRLSSVKYESDNFCKLFLYYYKEYKIYMKIYIEYTLLNNHFDIAFKRNIYKQYNIFI